MERFTIGYVLALGCFALSFARAQMTEFKFPLKKEGFTSPMTAPISSVFDHSFAGADGKLPKIIRVADKDSLVIAFTNERGEREPRPLYEEPRCYQNAKGVEFYVGGLYRANRNPPKDDTFYPNGYLWLCYDNHRGIDYPVVDKTPVYAAISGTISYPCNVVGLNNDQVKNNAVLELVPSRSSNLPYRIYYMHLSTDGQAQNTKCRPDAAAGSPRVGYKDETGGICPPKVYLPLEEGATVYAGCLIGLSGNTGVVEYHLHFEVHKLVPKTDPTLKAEAWELFKCPWIDLSLACVPVDPYGWGFPPHRYEQNEPYEALTGVKAEWLWERPPTPPAPPTGVWPIVR